MLGPLMPTLMLMLAFTVVFEFVKYVIIINNYSEYSILGGIGFAALCMYVAWRVLF